MILSSIENLQNSTQSNDFELENLRLNGQPDLSIISEENSHIPTDLCTSADEMKSDYENEQISESQVDLINSMVYLALVFNCCKQYND